MTDIEQKALALVNEIQHERGKDFHYLSLGRLGDSTSEALCRAIEQHEAFKQEVSDAVEDYHEACWPEIYFGFDHFIIPKPKPDPLVAAYHDALPETAAIHGKKTVIHLCGLINEALEARGLEIRSKNDD